MWNLTKVEVQLCNLLSPEGPQLSLESFNWGLVSIFSLSKHCFGADMKSKHTTKDLLMSGFTSQSLYIDFFIFLFI